MWSSLRPSTHGKWGSSNFMTSSRHCTLSALAAVLACPVEGLCSLGKAGFLAALPSLVYGELGFVYVKVHFLDTHMFGLPSGGRGGKCGTFTQFNTIQPLHQ